MVVSPFADHRKNLGLHDYTEAQQPSRAGRRHCISVRVVTTAQSNALGGQSLRPHPEALHGQQGDAGKNQEADANLCRPNPVTTAQGVALGGQVTTILLRVWGGGVGAAAPAFTFRRMNLLSTSIFNYIEVKEVSKVYCIRFQDALLSENRIDVSENRLRVSENHHSLSETRTRASESSHPESAAQGGV
jgi:hypothetical protein